MYRHLSHRPRCRPAGRRGQLGFAPIRFQSGRNFGIETPALTFSYAEKRQAREKVDSRTPVATGTEARAGSKEGMVRYVLLASLVLVVVLFAVAYELFS